MFVDSNVVVHTCVCEIIALSILVREVLDLIFVKRRTSWGHNRALGEIRIPKIRSIFLFGVIIL